MVACRNHRGEQERSVGGLDGNSTCKGNRRCSRGADVVGGSTAGGQHNRAPGAFICDIHRNKIKSSMQEWPRETPGRTVPWVGGQLLQQLPAATSLGGLPTYLLGHRRGWSSKGR